jgi:hypothetical protein
MTKTLIFKPTRWLLFPNGLLFVIFLLANLWLIDAYGNTSWPAVGNYVCTIVMAIVMFIGNKRLNRVTYLISDHSIQIQTANDDTTISLVNITDVSGRRHLRLPFTNFGKVIIASNDRQFEMIGIKDASTLAGIIKQAAEAAVARERQRSGPMRYTPPIHAAGTLEQKNDLVGLWQQGMLTDEEYREEVKRLTADR